MTRTAPLRRCSAPNASVVPCRSTPLLSHGGEPLLIVEGKLDRRHLDRASRLLGILTPWTIVDLEAIHPGAGGGVNRIAQYLRDNRPAVRSRLPDAPICVLLDPDVGRSGIKPIEEILTEEHRASRVLAIPEDLTNPNLHRSFGGIERLLGTELIEEAGDRGILNLLRDSDERWQIRKEQFRSSEKAQLEQLAGERSDPADYEHVGNLLMWLTREYSESGQRLL